MFQTKQKYNRILITPDTVQIKMAFNNYKNEINWPNDIRVSKYGETVFINPPTLFHLWDCLSVVEHTKLVSVRIQETDTSLKAFICFNKNPILTNIKIAVYNNGLIEIESGFKEIREALELWDSNPRLFWAERIIKMARWRLYGS